MTTDNILPARIEPLTGASEVIVQTEPRHIDQFIADDDQKLKAHYFQVRGQDTTMSLPISGTVLRAVHVAGAPTMVDNNAYANGIQQAQNQFIERINSLEAELIRTKQEVAQLKDMNTLLQQGIPDIIRKTLRDELRKPRWSTFNQPDLTLLESEPSSHKSKSSHKHHKSCTSRTVLKARDTPSKMTKKLLTTFFDRDTLAMSTLTGKGGKSKTLTKAQLDPAVVKTIVDKVTTTFGIGECSVRNVISQKCKEEMIIRRRRLGIDAKANLNCIL